LKGAQINSLLSISAIDDFIDPQSDWPVEWLEVIENGGGQFYRYTFARIADFDLHKRARN